MHLRRFFYENSLSLVMFGLFVLFLYGQSLAGWFAFNHDQKDHQQPAISYAAYLESGHFFEAIFENWESEFLRQKGSPESRPLDSKETPEDGVSAARRRAQSPWAARQYGWVRTIYENSLTLALFLLFILSFILHAVAGQHVFNEEQAFHGGEAVTLSDYVMASQFWFESFQNWQSEFLSVGTLILLSIVLRQKASPQSKPVSHPHGETGDK
jgi:hypothetical protein